MLTAYDAYPSLRRGRPRRLLDATELHELWRLRILERGLTTVCFGGSHSGEAISVGYDLAERGIMEMPKRVERSLRPYSDNRKLCFEREVYRLEKITMPWGHGVFWIYRVWVIAGLSICDRNIYDIDLPSADVERQANLWKLMRWSDARQNKTIESPKCVCPCHQSSVAMIHFQPCCEDCK